MPASSSQSKKCWRWYHPVLLLAIVVLLFVLPSMWLNSRPAMSPLEEKRAVEQMNISAPTQAVGEQSVSAPELTNKPKTKAFETEGVRWLWCAVMVLLTAFVLVAGNGITGLWRGAFIDTRNKISLSRFQMIVWTILIVSAYFTAVMVNISRVQPDPTDIALDPTLWMLMGISTTSLVGSALIKNQKKTSDPPVGSPPDAAREFELLAKQGESSESVGQLVVNRSPADASWADLFRGEEVTNAGHLDLGKIQMFYFTIIVVFAYGIGLGEMFRTNIYGIEAFPSLSSGIVALLGISHAGYLANKAVTRNPS